MRTVEYTYDALGRLQSVGDCVEDCDELGYQRKVVYHYEQGTGRLQREDYPNGSFVQYTYYGVDNPSQVGQVWKVEHKDSDGSLQLGYEYRYDLLGRFQTVVDLTTGAEVHLEYDGVGRRISEVRSGSPSYSIQRVYQLDGQVEQEYVQVVEADRTVEAWRLYDYDETSGRLRGVYDLTGGTNWWFEWDLDRLVRWHADDRNYVREFAYDEEGRITAIWLHWADSNQHVLGYAYQFNAEGERVWWRSGLNRLEFRRQCGGLTEWYREDGGSWAIWKQFLGSSGCGGCNDGDVCVAEWNEQAWTDAGLLPDGEHFPQALMAAIPAACAVACGCAAICALGAIVPCVRDCWGQPDAIGCVRQCVEGTIRELPRWAQILCGACLIGCAMCLVRALPGLRPPSRPSLPNHPQPPGGPLRPKPGKPRRMDPMKCWWLCHDHCNKLFPVEPTYRDEKGRYVLPVESPEYKRCHANCMKECLMSPPSWKPKPGYPYQ